MQQFTFFLPAVHPISRFPHSRASIAALMRRADKCFECHKGFLLWRPPRLRCTQPKHYLTLTHTAILHSKRPIPSPTPRLMLVKKEIFYRTAWREEKIQTVFDKVHSVPIQEGK
jgi:hypothetical protein